MDEIGEKCCKNEVEGNSSVPSSDATVQQAAAVTSSSGKSATAYESASKDGEEDGTDSTRSLETTLPTPTAVGSSIDAAGDSDASSSSKKDKQKLRKGKWTVCEVPVDRGAFLDKHQTRCTKVDREGCCFDYFTNCCSCFPIWYRSRKKNTPQG
jgi:hypothetical protein